MILQSSSQFLFALKQRSYIHQITHENELDQLLASKKIVAYIGFDCTAASLHIGSLVQIMILRYLQKTGHQPLIIIGGGTTKIGDPSGKDEARLLLADEQITANFIGIKNTLQKFDLSHQNPHFPAFKFIDNNDWLKDLNYIEFLRDFGRFFSVNKMLSFDSVRLRLSREQNLSFLEFNYMILQAFDFYYLNQNHDCVLQIGGSDQWGNIINGVELIRKIAAINGKNSEAYGLTTPLLTTADGNKMGKTANGAVWLDVNLLSVFDYFQYFRNIDDADLGRFLRFFTDLEISQIKELEILRDKEINHAKEILAFEATKICHGEEAAKIARQKAEEIFIAKNNSAFTKVEFILSKEEILNGKKLVDIIFAINAAPSRGDAKRLIKGRAIKINDIMTEDENYNFREKGEFNLAIGKKRFFKIIIKI